MSCASSVSLRQVIHVIYMYMYIHIHTHTVISIR
jgi:hypothetical protein